MGIPNQTRSSKTQKLYKFKLIYSEILVAIVYPDFEEDEDSVELAEKLDNDEWEYLRDDLEIQLELIGQPEDGLS